MFYDGPTDDPIKAAPPVKPESVCGAAYYNAAPDSGVYLENVLDKTVPAQSGVALYKVDYVQGHSDVRSELAVPVGADGVRVGVLNLESRLIDAFSQGHLAVALRFAEKAGRLYAAAAERQKRSRTLDPDIIVPAYSDLCRLFEKLHALRRSSIEASAGPVAILIYKADYIEGNLTAQDPKDTVLPGSHCRTPQFRFGQQPSLVASVFSRGEPAVFFSTKKAIEAGRISDEFDDELEISGAVAAFPVLIHGYIAGVVALWRMRGEDSCLDGRDVELSRRASHLIANGRNAPPGLHQPSFLNFQRAFAIVSLFDPQDKSVLQPSPSPYLDPTGAKWQATLSRLLKNFLKLLDEEERRFAKQAKQSRLPKDWISPRRCRCWVKSNGLASEETPRFMLALEVSLGDDPDRNLYDVEGFPEPVAIASEPFPRFEGPCPPPEPVEVRMLECESSSQALLYRGNPHQRFLLSRIRADRFARLQRPKVLGPDILATVLGKGVDRPWYIAPVVLGDRLEWVQDFRQVAIRKRRALQRPAWQLI